PIEIFYCFHPSRRSAFVRRHERQMLHSVGAVFLFVALKECDPFSVRTPFQTRSTAAAGHWTQLLFGGTRLCIGDEDLGRRFAIGVLSAIASERYSTSVWRPGRR